MGQPRRNEKRFYRYPMHRVAAIIADESRLDVALSSLKRVGVDLKNVNVLSGADGARLLDRTGRRHGLGARFLRFLQRGAYEMETLKVHQRALEDGHHVIYVPAAKLSDANRIAAALRAATGYELLYFRRFSVEPLTA